MSTRRLVADVGGTNVRFALANPAGGLEQVRKYRVADFASFEDALNAYLSAAGGLRGAAACAIAAAGAVDEGFVKLTNNAWSIDRAEIAKTMNGLPVALVNDLEAVAAALPHLTAGDLEPLGGPAPVRPESRTMLALNVGTGFGAASVVRRGGQWWTCPGEPGHMRLGAVEAREWDVLPKDAAVEDVLSGKGMVALYRRLAAKEAGSPAVESAADVFAGAGRDGAAANAVTLMTDVLGRMAGDLALAAAAWGGVYLCGSVARGWSVVADAERFRGAFARKGLMRARMERVPSVMVRRDDVSLFGLAMMTL